MANKRFKLEIYEDVQGEYRWRLIAINGRIVADSGEGYKNKGNVTKAVSRLRKLFDTNVFIKFIDSTKE